MQKAYSVLTLKSLDEDQRILTGIATTPVADRVMDIVDPKGARYEADIPFLWQHDHGSPVGRAFLGKATDAGIPFRAEIAKIDDAGPLKNIVDTAWQAIKAKLVRGVSIGFRAAEDGFEFLKGGGVKWTDYEIVELSAVTVPANAQATIQTIKALCNKSDDRIHLLNAVKRVEDLGGAVRLIRTV